MAKIEELLLQLHEEHEALVSSAEEHRQRAAALQNQARVVGARIQGIEETLADIPPPQAGNGAEPPPKQRRPRRDIKELVREYLKGSGSTDITLMAAKIDCAPAQVRKALAAIDAEGGP